MEMKQTNKKCCESREVREGREDSSKRSIIKQVARMSN
jgi:hypothetical protein